MPSRASGHLHSLGPHMLPAPSHSFSPSLLQGHLRLLLSSPSAQRPRTPPPKSLLFPLVLHSSNTHLFFYQMTGTSSQWTLNTLCSMVFRHSTLVCYKIQYLLAHTMAGYSKYYESMDSEAEVGVSLSSRLASSMTVLRQSELHSEVLSQCRGEG